MTTPEQGYKSITGLVDENASAPAPKAGVDFTPGAHPGALKTSTEIKCSVCGSLITTQAYELNGGPACDRCAVSAGAPVDSHTAFTTAVVYGIGAAFGGLAFYAGFTIAFHFYIGYVALAVGWMVGKAMMAGSKGIGGRRYQVAAALLTYAAISLASIPIMIAEVYEKGKDVDWAQFAPVLVVYGIASPILDIAGGAVNGLIGLVILFVGLRIAWKLTSAKKIKVTGPVGSF
ncbi:MAG: hypothetical protein ABR928_05245 [Terracidiphilus sp.]|jgi:hypothetical protein